MPWSELLLRQSLSELRGGMGTHLGNQKGGRGTANWTGARFVGVPQCFHAALLLHNI